ncbi:MAG: hypothetical protein FJ284_11435 [Planctomycetes bacterium]|nr:hypothetical protein [Planctomycetota bacterium]
MAGLAGKHLPGSSLGKTFTQIIVDYFTRLKSDDRYWYQNVLPRNFAREVSRTTLADVIRRDTTLRNLQSDGFGFDAQISGTVFGDSNRDGRLQSQERLLAGVAVTVLDAAGRTVTKAVTDARGRYDLKGLDVGGYRVRVSQPTGGDDVVRDLSVTRGGRLEIDPLGIPPRAQPWPTARTAAFAVLVAAATDPLPTATPSRPAGSIAVWKRPGASRSAPHNRFRDVSLTDPGGIRSRRVPARSPARSPARWPDRCPRSKSTTPRFATARRVRVSPSPWRTSWPSPAGSPRPASTSSRGATRSPTQRTLSSSSGSAASRSATPRSSLSG